MNEHLHERMKARLERVMPETVMWIISNDEKQHKEISFAL
jgi:hypothetical protein